MTIWKHLLTADEPFDEDYWCPEKERCSLCDERRKRKKRQEEQLAISVPTGTEG